MFSLSRGEAFVVGEGRPLGLQALLSQVLRRPPGRCRRVVQLVGEARRELAQGCHLLLLAQPGLRLAHAPGEGRDEDVADLGVLACQILKGPGRYLQDAARERGPCPVARALAAQVYELPGKLAGRVGRDRLVLSLTRDKNLPLQHHIEAVNNVVLGEEVLSLRVFSLGPVRGEYRELLFSELGEDPRITGLVHHRTGASSSASGDCSGSPIPSPGWSGSRT